MIFNTQPSKYLVPFFTNVNLLNPLRKNVSNTQIVEIKIKYETIQVHKKKL